MHVNYYMMIDELFAGRPNSVTARFCLWVICIFPAGSSSPLMTSDLGLALHSDSASAISLVFVIICTHPMFGPEREESPTNQLKRLMWVELNFFIYLVKRICESLHGLQYMVFSRSRPWMPFLPFIGNLYWM